MSNDTTIVLFSTADWNEPYWTNKQHTAQLLSKLGYSIVYVESIGLRAPKVGSAKDLKRIINRVATGMKTLIFGAEKKTNNLVVLSPLVVPNPKNHKVLKKLNDFLLNFLVKREIKKFSLGKLITWTYHPFILGLIGKIKSEKLIYHCVDDLSQVPGICESNFKKHEEKLLSLCDHVFVTTKSLEHRCSKLNDSVHYHSNVVDFDHFSKPSSSVNNLLDRVKNNVANKVVYHGVLSDFKVDFKLLFEVAKSCDDIDFYIIGQEREGQRNTDFLALQSLKNVHHLGYIPYSDLPDFLRYMDVGMLPTLLNEYTYSMFPMKYYEYVAAGLPVVSTALNFTEYTKNEALSVASSPEEFLNKILFHIGKGKLDPSTSRVIVGENTWMGRTKKMLSIIESKA
ncbi:glycosyltransferase [Enterovibrio sp. ZSDZ35]|uniref:Glycosyltransferase n=1 Tax=Enterovibrio qingdaonensis TaxID=2899818 RepID=A0ABT5QND4_9GAMM|nr:glycosyltransferase [Enterovibrio sp. ZSDZ35]MDD1782484.1 glycosyltransferase [Enterovibrio sp. ZSDZ35]